MNNNKENIELKYYNLKELEREFDRLLSNYMIIHNSLISNYELYKKKQSNFFNDNIINFNNNVSAYNTNEGTLKFFPNEEVMKKKT